MKVGLLMRLQILAVSGDSGGVSMYEPTAFISSITTVPTIFRPMPMEI